MKSLADPWVLLALIINSWGSETKEIENQPGLKHFNLNLILNYSITFTLTLHINLPDLQQTHRAISLLSLSFCPLGPSH